MFWFDALQIKLLRCVNNCPDISFCRCDVCAVLEMKSLDCSIPSLQQNYSQSCLDSFKLISDLTKQHKRQIVFCLLFGVEY